MIYIETVDDSFEFDIDCVVNDVGYWVTVDKMPDKRVAMIPRNRIESIVFEYEEE